MLASRLLPKPIARRLHHTTLFHNTDLSHSHPQNQFEGVGSPTTDATGTSQSNDSTTLEVNQPNSLPKTRVTLIACGIAAALITTVLLLHHKVH